MAANKSKSVTIKEIPLKDITILPGFNARKDLSGDALVDSKGKEVAQDTRASVEQFADAIAVQGQQSPVRVWAKDGKLVLVYGFRRYEAMRKLAERKVTPEGFSGPGLIRAEIWEGSEAEAKLANLTENSLRNALKPYELADRVKELRDRHGMNTDAVSAQLGKSKGYINNLVRVVDKCPAVILDAWRAGDGVCTSDNMVRWSGLKTQEAMIKEFNRRKGIKAEGSNGDSEPRQSKGPKPKAIKESVLREAIQAIKDSRYIAKDEKLFGIQCLLFATGNKASLENGSKGEGLIYDPQVEEEEEGSEDELEFDPAMFD